VSHPQPGSSTAGSGWRFQLRELLWLILLVALGLAWWRDHQQQAVRAELYERQIAQLHRPSLSDSERFELERYRQERSPNSSRLSLGSPISPSATPEEFVRIVAAGDQNAFHQALHSFARSAQAHESIPGLIALLTDSRSGHMAIQALGRIEGSPETVVPAVIPLLDHPNPNLVMAALQALHVRRSAARQAIPVLTAKMNDASSPLAVTAAIALKDIDPGFDLSKRLAEFLHSPLAEVRAAAVLNLESHIGPEEIEQLLTEMYPAERDESVRRAIANTLNRISRYEAK
jgi:HEAT repeat protein